METRLLCWLSVGARKTVFECGSIEWVHADKNCTGECESEVLSCTRFWWTSDDQNMMKSMEARSDTWKWFSESWYYTEVAEPVWSMKPNLGIYAALDRPATSIVWIERFVSIRGACVRKVYLRVRACVGFDAKSSPTVGRCLCWVT